MANNQYTATLYHDTKAISSQTGDDIKQLMISLLDMIETTTACARGIITNNRDGSVIKTVSKNMPNHNHGQSSYNSEPA